MGEIADAMIGGEMCAMCGVYLEENNLGIPLYCSRECAENAGIAKKDMKYVVVSEMELFNDKQK